MRALWEGQLDSPAPALFDLNGAMMEPRPRQDHIALWFGGHAPGALRRATSLGNGFIAGGGSTSDEFASAAQSLRKAAGPSFTIAKRVYIACSDHVSDAEQRLLRWLDDYYGDSSLSPRVAVAGDVATCLDKLRVLVEAGADYLILNFVFDEIASIRGAARDFLPVLRDWSTSVLRG